MLGLIDYLRKPFDLLDASTADGTAQHGIYTDTRTGEGHFSVANTQSSVSTYAASAGETDGETPESQRSRDPEAYDCADPRTCPDCRPAAADD